eukprot:8557022-Alexandrium_andersonii.AAC.1
MQPCPRIADTNPATPPPPNQPNTTTPTTPTAPLRHPTATPTRSAFEQSKQNQWTRPDFSGAS